MHIAARVAALAPQGETLTTRTVKDLTAGAGLTFSPFGSHVLKGVPEPWEILRAS